MVDKKRVAIIGAGPAGLVSGKEALAQGLIPTIFEKNSCIGGVWNLSNGNTWDTMTTNVSKYFVDYSDFPWSKTTPVFPSPQQVYEYLSDYANHFGLVPYLKLNSQVVNLSQLNDDKWLVKWNESNEDIFDFLIIACGMYTTPYMPVYSGQNDFKGVILHSKDYQRFKNKNTLDGKKVIVVGASYSACDISGDLAKQNAQVVNVFRKPYWNLKKVHTYDPKDLSKRSPVDFGHFNRRRIYSLKFDTHMEENIFMNTFFSTISSDQQNIPNLHIDPNSHEPANVSISDTYLVNVKNGIIEPKQGYIKSLDAQGMNMEDGTHIDADIILWCTGYRLLLNYMDESILQKLEYNQNDPVQPFILYRYTFSQNVNNFACIGLYKEPIFSALELQARYVSLVFSGKIQLPNTDKIEEDLEQQRHMRNQPDRPQSVNEKFTEFSDQFAEELGFLPNFEELKMNDPELYEMLWNGPPTSAVYRLKDQRELALTTIREAYQVRQDFLNNN